MKPEASDPELRRLIVKACRILFAEGHTEWAGMSGHVSARLSKRNTFAIKPVAVGFDEIAPEDLVVGDMEGRKISGRHKLPGETAIHIAIFLSRPDVRSVIHTHPPFGTALSCTKQRLIPLSFPAAILGTKISCFDAGSPLIHTLEQGLELAKALGDRAAIFLKNHGVVVVGRSVEESTVRAIALENAVKLQGLASHLGSPSPLAPGFFSRMGDHYGDARLRSMFDYAARRHRPRSGQGIRTRKR